MTATEEVGPKWHESGPQIADEYREKVGIILVKHENKWHQTGSGWNAAKDKIITTAHTFCKLDILSANTAPVPKVIRAGIYPMVYCPNWNTIIARQGTDDKELNQLEINRGTPCYEITKYHTFERWNQMMFDPTEYDNVFYSIDWESIDKREWCKKEIAGQLEIPKTAKTPQRFHSREKGNTFPGYKNMNCMDKYFWWVYFLKTRSWDIAVAEVANANLVAVPIATPRNPFFMHYTYKFLGYPVKKRGELRQAELTGKEIPSKEAEDIAHTGYDFVANSPRYVLFHANCGGSGSSGGIITETAGGEPDFRAVGIWTAGEFGGGGAGGIFVFVDQEIVDVVNRKLKGRDETLQQFQWIEDRPYSHSAAVQKHIPNIIGLESYISSTEEIMFVLLTFTFIGTCTCLGLICWYFIGLLSCLIYHTSNKNRNDRSYDGITENIKRICIQ